MKTGDDVRVRAAALADVERKSILRGLVGSDRVERAFDSIVRTAFPPVCAGCGVSGHWVCPVCDQDAQRITLDSVCVRCGTSRSDDSRCNRCADWSAAVSACRSAYVFDGVVRTTIHRLKYHGEYARAEWCGLQIARMIIELGWQPDLIAPVPLHRSRLRSRGYNQSAKIAGFTARLLDIPTGGVVVRTRATLSQVGLDAEGRRANVEGAFDCLHDLSDLSVLLIDDVVTTGATLDASAKACRAAGAASVLAATVASGA